MLETAGPDTLSEERSWLSTNPRTGVDAGTPAMVLDVSENEPWSVSSRAAAAARNGRATTRRSCSALVFPRFGTGLSFPKIQKDCTADRSKHGDGSNAFALSSVFALFELLYGQCGAPVHPCVLVDAPFSRLVP